jgi:hypothetical protein
MVETERSAFLVGGRERRRASAEPLGRELDRRRGFLISCASRRASLQASTRWAETSSVMSSNTIRRAPQARRAAQAG